ncbi:MAG: GNAT family N-acetyltransferase [Christensenellales bacterium]|jgi:GNAT superfamily N-acetyltransferase
MISYQQVDQRCFPQYDMIPMRVNVSSEYRIEKIDGGLGGFRLIETPVKPYIKDFCSCADEDESIACWRRWDLSNWAFFMAFEGARPIAGAAVASRTEGVNMLSGRDDLAVLWDIRVEEAYKQMGIGQALFDMAVNWCRSQGLRQMKIECQNNNVPACKFYRKQGAVLMAVDECAYFGNPKYRHEAQLIWYLDVN